ncbi:hypothetical protein [Neorhizobium galegae]|jgi:hypothetical protein|uniref:hypothetical protein n=1 Tax=Neorhizobium galegae TaxID=399 RepID=UPI00210471E9|nr:hypothetical protein [Neorhizobium galegae]MCQ1836223.1 hypothetical protein [Neorhizobium galegae]UIY28314.1 hypothetical protein LZK73_15200 [Neorhizobium galegae]
MAFMLYRFIVFALTSFAVAGTASAEQLQVTIKAGRITKADVVEAVRIFREKCRPLGDAAWEDVTKVEADVFEEYAGHRLKRGWKYTLHLAVHYADAPKVGPAFSEEAGVLSGHVLHYDLGGGQTPGFLAAKRSSQFLCGVPIDHKGSDVFVPVPQFAFLTAGY